jgi:[acyl-carrier-protein] S-malonyltransferase
MERIALEFIKKCLVFAVCTQNNNWNEAEYLNGVIVSLQKVKQLFAKLEEEKREPEVCEMKEVLRMVLTVFKTKRISPDEQFQRLNELARIAGAQEILGDVKERIG